MAYQPELEADENESQQGGVHERSGELGRGGKVVVLLLLNVKPAFTSVGRTVCNDFS